MIAQRILSLASTAAILAVALIVSTNGACCSEPFLVTKDVDAPGFDYKRADGVSLENCRSLCAGDGACGAFTYNVKARVCFLKSSNNVRLTHFKGAITGIKTSSAGQASPGSNPSETFMPTSGQSGQYVVDGFALGAKVDPKDPNYRSYKCKPSDEIPDVVECNRSREASSGNALVSSTLIHDKDGTTLYGMVNVAPVNITDAIVQKEIGDLSKSFNAQPSSVLWLPNPQERTSVIATWGPVKLEELGWEVNYSISQGQDPHLGILVGALGDPTSSAEGNQPVYRLVGGPGYVYSASFGNPGQAHRRYVAIDASQLAIKQFQASLRKMLRKDAALPSDDYSLWSDVALRTRELALDTSPDVANRELDNVFGEFDSKKLQSHVWSVIPSGAIARLGQGKYWRHDIYGPRTKHPQIRSDAQTLIAKSPSEPFIELAYFVVGDLQGALDAKPDSVVGDVIHYGRGHRIVQSLAQDALEFANAHVTPQTPAEKKMILQGLLEADSDDISEGELESLEYVNLSIRFINQNPDFFDNKPLGEHLANFAERAAEARQHFEYVLKNPSSPHTDDAAYMIGWLEMHQGNVAEALTFFARALNGRYPEGVIVEEDSDEEDEEGGSADYDGAALRQNVRIMLRMPPQAQYSTVDASEILSREPSLWYVAARSAYRNFDYARTIEICEQALGKLKIPIDSLPVTTSPARISAALGKINPEFVWDPNLVEIPYLIEASRELSRYEEFLSDLGTMPADAFAKKARPVIIKYSMLVDQSEGSSQSNQSKPPSTIGHKDLRQALHLIDITLEKLPEDQAYDSLREWLCYRKGRILAIYAPHKAREAIDKLREAFPTSKYLDDAFAELIFAQGIMLGDVDAAQKTFAELLDKYPNGNSVDNAYSWMAIILRCDGQLEEAAAINKQIVARFPLTRHAKYAVQRLADPDRWLSYDSGCGPVLAAENY